MAAPVATDRSVPVGFMLKNGYQALITFSIAPDLELWEKVVTPPGYSFGEKIDITTQHNKQVRTAASRRLAEVKDAKFTCAYDPEFYDDFLNFAGINQTITKTFPDGSQLAFYGYLSDFEPDGEEEGKQPDATVTIKVTNTDPNLGADLAARFGREGFPEQFGGGTGTAFLVNEFPPKWYVN